MPDTVNLTQAYELDLVVAEYIAEEVEADALLSVLPLGFKNTPKVVWEQPDPGYGLLSLRGVNGVPDVSPVTGFKRFSMVPGYYGEVNLVDEQELIESREIGTVNEPVNADNLIGWRVQQQTAKAMNQVRNILATFLSTGKFLVRSRDGRITHADSVANFNLLTPGVGWAADPTNADPIADLLGWMNTLQTGTSSKFGGKQGGKLLMQTATLNDLLACKKIRDVYRIEYGNTPLGIEGLNKIFLGFGLPAIEVYDEGYFPALTDSAAGTNFTRFLPRKTIIWVGTRPKNDPIGMFQFTKNLVNAAPAGPGAGVDYREPNPDLDRFPWSDGLYTLVEWQSRPPVGYRIDIGFNGGPALRHPSAVAGIVYT